MKIGIIYCAYNVEEYIEKSLAPWVELRSTGYDSYEFMISAVSIPFSNFENSSKDNTQSVLRGYLTRNQIDSLFIEPENIDEWIARDLCLQSLLKNQCDIIVFVDGDEFYTKEEILNSLNFISFSTYVAWFRGSLKNYVFNNRTYIEEPFTPPRWYRVHHGPRRILKMSYDNDIVYIDQKNNIIPHTQLPSMTIPKELCFTKHLTWLSDERTKNKIAYQVKRWGADGCSYAWNDKDNQLIWNASFFKKNGQKLPQLVVE